MSSLRLIQFWRKESGALQVSNAGQAFAFLGSVVGGMLAALIFDLFRVKRKTLHSGAVLTFFEDLLFWIVVSVIIIGVLILYNDGEVRGYIFIGTVIGAVLYALLLSRIVTRVFGHILETAILIFRVLGRPVGTLSGQVRRNLVKVRRSFGIKASGISASYRLFRRLVKKI